MTIVSDARSTLQNGASTVLSTVQHNKTARRLIPARTQKLMKQVNRRLAPQGIRRVPVLPIAIAVGLAAVGTAGGILVSRYLASKPAREDLEEKLEVIAAIPEEAAKPKETAIAD